MKPQTNCSSNSALKDMGSVKLAHGHLHLPGATRDLMQTQGFVISRKLILKTTHGNLLEIRGNVGTSCLSYSTENIYRNVRKLISIYVRMLSYDTATFDRTCSRYNSN
jgi:hypothetical protein